MFSYRLQPVLRWRIVEKVEFPEETEPLEPSTWSANESTEGERKGERRTTSECVFLSSFYRVVRIKSWFMIWLNISSRFTCLYKCITLQTKRKKEPEDPWMTELLTIKRQRMEVEVRKAVALSGFLPHWKTINTCCSHYSQTLLFRASLQLVLSSAGRCRAHTQSKHHIVVV